MIELQLRAKFKEVIPPFVIKAAKDESEIVDSKYDPRDYARIEYSENGVHKFSSGYTNFEIHSKTNDNFVGDVFICIPNQGLVQRIFRRNSKHNTILFTERCDQLCVMCSQPPKNKDFSWLFPLYEKVLLLLDPDTLIGISGGEPTLYKHDLLGIIERVNKQRPDISFHILTNAQHFAYEDRDQLKELHKTTKVTWGIPLYSHQKDTHEEIVGKVGSFDKLMENLLILGSTDAKIELRTVVTALNFLDIPHIAKFVGKNIPFISDWAIMGLEPIGYAKANKDRLFIDHTAHPEPLISAIEISEISNLPCHLFNIPLCTMPNKYRGHCIDSISDWKKKFLPECQTCSLKKSCSGFFEWYNEEWQWSGVRPQ